MDHPFRTAALGGFNRQDVLDFLEKTANEAAEKQQELQRQIEALEQLKTLQEADLSGLREQVERLEKEGGELRARLARTEEDLTASRAACGEKTAALETARRELEELRARADALAPDAAAYAELKERTAGVELDAHRRAQAIQEEAEGRAAELRRQMKQWLQRVEREYDALRTQVETTVSHAADQLDRAGKCLDQAAGMLDGQDAALEALAGLCEPPAQAPETK